MTDAQAAPEAAAGPATGTRDPHPGRQLPDLLDRARLDGGEHGAFGVLDLHDLLRGAAPASTASARRTDGGARRRGRGHRAGCESRSARGPVAWRRPRAGGGAVRRRSASDPRAAHPRLGRGECNALDADQGLRLLRRELARDLAAADGGDDRRPARGARHWDHHDERRAGPALRRDPARRPARSRANRQRRTRRRADPDRPRAPRVDRPPAARRRSADRR